MKIAIIGHLKHCIAAPYAGGLEMFTHGFVRSLQQRGHDVTLFASGDSDASLSIRQIVEKSTIRDCRECFGKMDDQWIERTEDAAYERLMRDLLSINFDIIHNHSLSPVPLRYADQLPTELITTFHTPLLPRIADELSQRGSQRCGSFINISRANAASYASCVATQSIIHNGIDASLWFRAPIQKIKMQKVNRAIWMGRIVPDKGVSHAIDAAHRAGIPIDLVGPISDSEYFANEVRPRLHRDDHFHGHQSHDRLRQLIARSRVALVTPCWDEPFGLVVVEALACGTPVAGYARGALPEIVAPHVGRLAPPNDTMRLAQCIMECECLSPKVCQDHIVKHFSLQRMMDKYEQFYANRSSKVAA